MTRPKNPQPTQIPHRLERPRRRTSNRITSNRRILERTLSTICDRVCDSESAEPVTDPVCVARPDERRDAGLDDR